MDAVDRKILDLLQQDATLPVAELAEQVGISAAPCWRRVKKLEASGVIRRRVALVDRRKVNVPTTVFVAVKAPRHAADWSDAFRRVVAGFPEIVEAWRLTGEIDYLCGSWCRTSRPTTRSTSASSPSSTSRTCRPLSPWRR